MLNHEIVLSARSTARSESVKRNRVYSSHHGLNWLNTCCGILGRDAATDADLISARLSSMISPRLSVGGPPRPAFELRSKPLVRDKDDRVALEAMKLSVLQKKAAAVGATAEEIERAVDEANPKSALADLILSKSSAGQQDNVSQGNKDLGIVFAEHQKAERAVRLGNTFCFILYLGLIIQGPFHTETVSKLNCDELCLGSMESMQAGVGFIGSMIFGRFSDYIGRRIVLGIGVLGSLLSIACNGTSPTLPRIVVGYAVGSFFSHTHSITKAFFADYYPSANDKAELAAAIGQLGMVTGFAYMAGTGLAAHVASSLGEAQRVSIAFLLASLILLAFVPTSAKEVQTVTHSKTMSSLQQLLSLPELQKPGARFLVVLRFSMGWVFALYNPIMQASFKQRFDFTAKDHGQLHAFMGFVYAMAQGFIAPKLVGIASRRRAGSSCVLFCCMCVLGLGRVAVLLVTDVSILYASSALLLVALGTANTIIAADATKVIVHNAGGFYGVLQATEGFASMTGPVLGGLLAHVSRSYGFSHLVLQVVVAIYSMNTLAVGMWHHKYFGEKVASADHEKLH